MGHRNWSKADIARLFEMRDVQRLSWDQIASVLDGTTGNSCCARYSYEFRKRCAEAARRGQPLPERRSFKAERRARAKPADQTPAPAAPAIKPLPAPEQRPQYFHEADMDIMARIERQGLTAGLFGDPPPGRSALDQRNPR